MAAPDREQNPAALHRALGLRDLVLLNISCVVGLSSLAQVAQFGYASLTLYPLAVLLFLIPSGLTVAELSARMPAEGGFYQWTRTAFGDFHGYVAAWSYWLSNMVWLPTVMLLFSMTCLYAGGKTWLGWSDNPWYHAAVCLGFLWVATLLNILGMERAKWIQNVGATATWVAIALLLVGGLVFVAGAGSVHPFAAEKLVPDFGDLSLLPFFAIVAFSFGGLELAPVLSGEIRNPARNVPRAIVLSSIAIVLIYMAGTLMLIFTVAEGEVGIIEGVVQAFHEVGSALRLPLIGAVGALLVALSTMGRFGSWMTGAARLPFVVGLDRYLPEAFARVHPRWGSPWVALVMQAIVLSALFLASIAGSTVKEAFLVLLDMSVILYFIPLLYMFAAMILHVLRDPGGPGILRILRRRPAFVWLIAGPGFAVTLLSTVLAVIPSGAVENRTLFVAKVVGGAALLIGAGLVVYFLRRGKAGSVVPRP